MYSFKNILFDLGAVLINIDPKNAQKYFASLGIHDYEFHFNKLSEKNIFNDLETGKISPDQFLNSINIQLKGAASETDIKNAWNAILMEFRAESMKHVTLLSQRYNVYLLSNTNAIHLTEINQILFKQLGVALLDNYFKKAYYSQLIGMRKPEAEIYQYVLKDAGIIAQETFFIDDLSVNIETAQRLGFKTHLLLPDQRIEKLEILQL